MAVIGQWAQSTVTAVAPNTATLHITAVASAGGGNWTYTYTVTQGSVTGVIAGGALYVIVSGMQNAGNNGTFTPTTFGSGTFTVANGTGVAESGSNGTGNCPSDSGVGIGVFCTVDGKNGYFFHSGTNSFSGDGRTGYHELWKFVSGAGTLLSGQTTTNAVPPSVNDVLAVSTENGTVTAWINGLVPVFQSPSAGPASVVDPSLTNGTQGINIFSIVGNDEYLWSKWSVSGGGGVSSSDGGNNGTQANNWLAGNVLQTQLLSDSFAYTNGDLHTKNANWVYTAGSAQISSNKCYWSSATAGAAYRSDASPNADQYSEVTAVVTGAAATQNCGPAVRVSTTANTFYAIQYANNVFAIVKYVAGTQTSLISKPNSVSFPITGDVLKLTARGTILTAWKNGVAVMSVSDVSIASGNIGIFGAGNSTTNGYSAWDGGNYSWLQTKSDTFARANGSLGSQWTVFPNTMESVVNLTQAGVNIVSNAYSSLTSNGGDAYAVFGSGLAYAPGSSEGSDPLYSIYYPLLNW